MKRILKILALTATAYFSLTFINPSAWADYQAGLTAFGAGNYDLALKEWKPLAEGGDPKAQHGMGLLYEMGKGVEKPDYAQAAKWYELAAKQHFAAAENNLALLYVDGRGVAKDEKKAIELWQLAAEAGNPWAQFNLGNRYAQGWGVAKDDQKAVQYWQDAAEAGNGPASYNLGLLYYHKQDEQSLLQAVKYFSAAAKTGLPEAQYAMGELARQGKGVEHDLQKAAQWYQLAANNGNDLGRQRLDELAKSGIKPPPITDSNANTATARNDTQIAPLPDASSQAPASQPQPPSDNNNSAASETKSDTTVMETASTPIPTKPSENTKTEVPLREGIGQIVEVEHPVFRVWLGQKKDEADARTQWLKLYAKYPQVFSGIRADYRRFDLGEQGTIFRLFAGEFSSREEADKVCRDLKEQDSRLFCRSVVN